LASLFFAAGLGAVAGLLPVYLGLVPLWFMRRIPESWRSLIVSISLGILLFLFVDVTGEGVRLAGSPGLNSLLFVVGLSLGVFAPLAAARRGRVDAVAIVDQEGVAGEREKARFFTAYMIAVGLGMHNLGEGLAIGAAYSAGELALTSVLVVGFALHNATEGFGIAAPVASLPLRIRQPLAMGFLAGFPTILGSMLGFVAYSQAIGSLFFSVAGGALLYVIFQLVRLAYVASRTERTFLGVVLGMILMYLTGILVST